VVDALVAAGQARLDRGVQAGHLTDEQAARRGATLPARVAAAVDNPITLGGADARSGLRRRLAAALGMSPADLRQARADGQSVAEIAEAHGIDLQQVIDQLVARSTERITERITALVEGDGDGSPGRCG
jgi:hypothetical protein